MNNRERALAILNYQPYNRLPIVHFGYWTETLEKWAAEGHITRSQATGWRDNNPVDRVLCERLGFDFGWGGVFGPHLGLQPAFRRRVVAQFPDGSRHVLDQDGVTNSPEESQALDKSASSRQWFLAPSTAGYCP